MLHYRLNPSKARMPQTNIARLDGPQSTLVIELTPNAPPVWRHFGARLSVQDASARWRKGESRPLPPATGDYDLPLTVLPAFGFGWFGQPGLLGSRSQAGGEVDWAQELCLDDWRQQGQQLTLQLSDKVAQLAVTLRYTLHDDADLLTVETELKNLGDTPFRLDWLAAAVIPLPVEADQIIAFTGSYALEFQEARQTLGVGTWRRDNRRGRTSHDSFPGVIVGNDLQDCSGPVWGAHLGWSGNHSLLIEPTTDGSRQLQLGEWLAPGEVVLAAGETYVAPTAYLSFSPDGLNGLSHNFHRYVRQHLTRWPNGAMRPRPVHLNTWEAVYFNHDLADLQSLASAGAAVGVERFVLDDGWFHGRGDDRAALGDWWPDEGKYPAGLHPLVDHVSALGMQFGLWVEPEMVNPDSDLFRAHPDWALQLAGRPQLTARNQLVLDMARPEVEDYLFDAMDALLRQYPIAYLKWDQNRDLTTAGHQGKAGYRSYVQGFYRLLSRLRAAHPQVEIESCASGGGRPDFGALRHTHRIWPSDCNDALTRLSIQRGCLRFLPPELMGAHIGPSPAHSTGRQHTLAFRAGVALFGHLGLEMDVRDLDPQQRSELAAWITTYKRWRELLHKGQLRQGMLADALQWQQVTAADRQQALLAVYRLNNSSQRYAPHLRLHGLDAAREYRLTLALPQAPQEGGYGLAAFGMNAPMLQALAAGELTLSGAMLMETGLPLPSMPPETVLLIAIEAR